MHAEVRTPMQTKNQQGNLALDYVSQGICMRFLMLANAYGLQT